MLEARGITAGHGRAAPVLADLSLHLARGEILGLAGPSGSGKTTLGRVLAGLHPPRAGRVTLDGAPLPRRGSCPVQYVAQHPQMAMNPRWRINRVLAEAGPPDPALAGLLQVAPDWLDRFPQELSGGQLQRVALLRALGAAPRVLVADELTASMDALSQARIWQVLRDLAERSGLAVLAISHDAALLDRIASRILRLP